MSSASQILNQIKEENIKFVDLRFTDPRGKLQHLTMDAAVIDEDTFEDGIMFDGSSIAGWKAINESDMVLMPDPASSYMDPFFGQSTMSINCDILEPATYQPYNRDPRTTAKKAEAYLKSSGVGDTVVFGPEPEFFLFDDVKYSTTPYNTGFKLDHYELLSNSDADYEAGNTGHHIPPKGGYFPVPPLDSAQDIRSEMISVMSDMGVTTEKHHHEVGSSQHELGIKFAPIIESADQVQIYKYVVQQVANAYGKTATFMPKPVYGDNGTGMHCHQSIWKDGKPLFAGEEYAGLSREALYYIGGVIKHAKAINAFTNPSTNSYKRLIPGFEAPVNLAYSSRNRSAAVRIPMYSPSPKAKRLECRFPDPSCNPYFAFSAMAMAGMDGIQNKIDPGDPLDKDIYGLSPEELAEIPSLPGTLEQAINELEIDHEFLLKGDVFTEDVIETWIDYKRTKEIDPVKMEPNPVEFSLYYDI